MQTIREQAQQLAIDNESLALEFLNSKLKPKKKPVEFVDVLQLVKECVLEELENKQYLKLGLEAIDCLSYKKRGFRKGELLILAGKPGTGKTALLAYLIEKRLGIGKKVLCISSEMGEKSLVMRMIQKHAKDWEEAILEREKKAQNLDLIFSMDIEEIEAYIEKSTAELVIIDFLQNITVANGSSSREKIRDVIARIIKAIKDKKFCILASQFNAEGQRGKIELSNLGGGLAGGQLADFIYGLELLQTNEDDGSREIAGVCLKNRHGHRLHHKLHFNPNAMERKTDKNSRTYKREAILPDCTAYEDEEGDDDLPS